MIYLSRYRSPLGEINLSATQDALTGLWFDGQVQRAEIPVGAAWMLREDLPLFRECRRWLDAYFGGDMPAVDAIPLAPFGSAFRLRVWRALLAIPYGETVTYGDLAAQLGRDEDGGLTSPRAVGGAVGRNPIAVIIPCHRVLGKNGKLCGYSGGLLRKASLLRRECAPLV